MGRYRHRGRARTTSPTSGASRSSAAAGRAGVPPGRAAGAEWLSPRISISPRISSGSPRRRGAAPLSGVARPAPSTATRVAPPPSGVVAADPVTDSARAAAVRTACTAADFAAACDTEQGESVAAEIGGEQGLSHLSSAPRSLTTLTTLIALTTLTALTALTALAATHLCIRRRSRLVCRGECHALL